MLRSVTIDADFGCVELWMDLHLKTQICVVVSDNATSYLKAIIHVILC